MKITHFQLGEARKRGDKAFRISVTRRPPRGVPREEWESFGKFDAWFPFLAPSARLLTELKSKDWRDERVVAWFYDRYEKELSADAEKRSAVELLARLSARMPIAIGCYCADADRCHRKKLVEVVKRQRGAR
jgi:Uncharacterized conserved protein